MGITIISLSKKYYYNKLNSWKKTGPLSANLGMSWAGNGTVDLASGRRYAETIESLVRSIRVMAYAIHIERENTPITLEEWKSSVLSIENAKIDSSPTEVKNPSTGEIIVIPSNEGDVAVLFKTKGILGFNKKKEWVKAITFFEGRASFNAAKGIESPSNPVRLVASELAKKLDAHILGDNGEKYEW